ncbi:Cytochrome P450 2J4 [Pseudolycoriella hygida]|uniref:Cytochrome P450 2J4 n=1 Tax=Pseudolycoriella hygida TaxID=35572 RepID=A0A9Q0NAC7_9DIPT|nr:Cytochrome P450 2J4 [Pseudolycoriella hygida]
MILQFLLILTICALVVNFLKVNGNRRLPPGPIRIPVLGSVLTLYRLNPTYPHLALAKLAQAYGDIVTFGFGMQTAVAVSSYEAMKDLFKLQDTNLSRHQFSFVSDRNYGQNLGIIFSHGQKWVEVRAFTKKTLKQFGFGKFKMDQSFTNAANQLVDAIKSEMLDSHDRTFAVKNSKFAIHVLNVLWGIVGGYKFDLNDENLRRNMECVDEILKIIGNENPYTVFPFLKTWFPNQVNYPEHLKIHDEVHGFTEFLINDAIEKRGERLDTEPTSFIELFLDKIDECHGDPGTIFTHQQLVIILEDLMLGSLETTAALLSWSILFMVLHTDKQNKIRQEILKKMESRGELTATELKGLPYLKATILEVMRMGNIAPLPSPRSASKDLKFRDYVIPKNTILLYNLYPIYNEKSYWIDPEVFRPERFLNENGEIDQSRSERILGTVFGVGPRICFGENIGLDAFFTFFAAMITNFKFDVVPGKEPRVDNPRAGMSIAPQEFPVKIRSR